ncbi:hypothetical protein [Terrisporobacter vanillatitrophus]|uniref:hypothetical protein n=1 Tax=Terrisporobacter vanillatitrophus TaxID=3058402 RepID=UPI0033691BB3
MKNNEIENIKKYLVSKKVLSTILDIFENKDLSIEDFIGIINTIAELIDFNNQCKYSELFKTLADKIVYIIELFNVEDNNISQANINSIIEDLKIIILKLINDIENKIRINVYFRGEDKYNILEKSLNKNIQIIDDIDIASNTDVEMYQINILIISEETINYKSVLKNYYDDIIFYDKTMNYIFNICENIYYNNYDYYYLLESLEKAKVKDVESIVVGNSYPLTGIDVNLLEHKAVSLALSSQDLYYSYKLAKLAISNNNSIKRCILGTGYYLVNHDLYKSKNQDAISRVKNVYYPILKDKHNSEQVDSIEILTIKKVLKEDVMDYIFNLDFLDKHFKNLIFRDNNGYFNINLPREKHNMLGNLRFSTISESDKFRLGEVRANQHNKLCKYTKTTDEYNCIFNEFIDFLIDNNVEPIIVVFPSTKYYSKFLNVEYKEEFYRITNAIKARQNIKIIDFSKQDIFLEEDFIDLDHMSRIGATKVTKKLNEILTNE